MIDNLLHIALTGAILLLAVQVTRFGHQLRELIDVLQDMHMLIEIPPDDVE